MSTIIRIAPAADRGWARVVVESEFADDFYKHYRAVGTFGHTSLTTYEVPEVCVETDSSGQKSVVVKNDCKTFEVQAKPEALAPILMNWISSRTKVGQ